MSKYNPDYFKEYYQKNKKRRLANDRYRHYGITQEQYEQMLEQQGHRCFICFTSDPKGKGWNVDHCHATGKVRGILCVNCNSMLGHARDNIVRACHVLSRVALHSILKEDVCRRRSKRSSPLQRWKRNLRALNYRLLS